MCIYIYTWSMDVAHVFAAGRMTVQSLRCTALAVVLQCSILGSRASEPAVSST